MKCDLMRDVSEADYVRAGISSHDRILIAGKSDEEMIRTLGIEKMADLLMKARLHTMFHSETAKAVYQNALVQHLNDCDVNRRLGHID